MSTLFERVTFCWNFNARKHDLGDDFTEKQVNAMTNYELLQAISEALEEEREENAMLTTGKILSMDCRANITNDEKIRFARAIEAEVRSEAQEPVAFPIPPAGIIAHPNIGELYDRLQMQQYAMKYATLYTAPQPPAPCPDCEARANGDTVLVPNSELKKLQAKVAELEDKLRVRSERSED